MRLIHVVVCPVNKIENMDKEDISTLGVYAANIPDALGNDIAGLVLDSFHLDNAISVLDDVKVLVLDHDFNPIPESDDYESYSSDEGIEFEMIYKYFNQEIEPVQLNPSMAKKVWFDHFRNNS